MSNVLPGDARASVRSMYRARFLMMAGLVVIATCALAALALLPSYLALHAVETPADSSAASTVDRSDTSAVAQTQAALKIITPIVGATTTPGQALALALKAKPAGVHITDIAYTSGKPGVLTLLGSADSPTVLDAYRRALASTTPFVNASVPVSDLAGATDGHFSMTVSGTF